MKNYTSNPEHDKTGYSGHKIKQGKIGSKIVWDVYSASGGTYYDRVHFYIIRYDMMASDGFYSQLFVAKLFEGHPVYSDIKNNLFDDAAAQKFLLKHVSLEELMDYSYDCGHKAGRNSMRESFKSLLKAEH